MRRGCFTASAQASADRPSQKSTPPTSVETKEQAKEISESLKRRFAQAAAAGGHRRRDLAVRRRSRIRKAGSFHSIEGIPHFLSATAAAHLLDLAEHFELVWCSGWEEKADEHLPHLLGLPAGLPFLRFDRSVGRSNAHWKLDAIDAYAGERPLAWIDDAFNAACHEWAQRARGADAARADRPRARAHAAGAGAAAGVGAGSCARR